MRVLAIIGETLFLLVVIGACVWVLAGAAGL